MKIRVDDGRWRVTVRAMLSAGFGVDDIVVKAKALRMNITPQMVRLEIYRLRSSGQLMSVLFPEKRRRGRPRKIE